MTTPTTDKPTHSIALSSPASIAAALSDMRTTHETTGTLPIEQIIWCMRQSDRTEMIHYAGASHRDPVAWHVTRAWLDQPGRTESECKSLALRAAWSVDLTPEQIRANNPGMR